MTSESKRQRESIRESLGQVSAALVLLLLAAAPGLRAQFSLTTTYASNNGQYGNMFDVVALQNLSICSFDINLDSGTFDVEVYSVSGSYAAVQTQPSAWGAPIAVRSSLVSNGLNVPTPLQLSLQLSLAAGNTRGFYITVRNGPGINYTNGAPGSEGSVYASDQNLEIRVGAGLQYPFLFPQSPRIWNGAVHYATTASCPPSRFQRNQTSLGLTIGGALSDGNSPAVHPSCVGALAQLVATSPLAGNLYELGWTFSPVLPRGTPGTSSSPRQTINLDSFHPTLGFLNGGSAPAFAPLPPAFSFGLTASVPLFFAAQMAVVDAGHPDGYALSQASLLDASVVGIVPGPTDDDAVVSVPLTAPPLCASPASFSGTAFTTIHVSSNGRITFNVPSAAFTPTVAEALSGPPFLGVWMDLDPSTSGSIEVRATAPGQLEVHWDDVAPFAAPIGTTVDLKVRYVAASAQWSILGLQSLIGTANPAFLGLSRGASGATNAGPTNFVPGGSGSLPSSLAMLFQFGPASALGGVTTGVDSIAFTPLSQGAAGYAWAAQ